MFKLIFIALLISSSQAYDIEQVRKECSEHTGVYMKPHFTWEQDIHVYADNDLRDLNNEKFTLPISPSKGSVECDKPLSTIELSDLLYKTYKDDEEEYQCPCYFFHTPTLTLRSLVQVSKNFKCCVFLSESEVKPYHKPISYLNPNEIINECIEFTNIVMIPAYYKSLDRYEPIYDTDDLDQLSRTINLESDDTDKHIKCDKKINAKQVIAIMKNANKTDNCQCYFNYRRTMTLRSLVLNSRGFECCPIFINPLENPDISAVDRINIHMNDFVNKITFDWAPIANFELMKSLTSKFIHALLPKNK